jgi:NADH dehydrogenase (ubiquinone) 1 beta subcomplex subunit 3
VSPLAPSKALSNISNSLRSEAWRYTGQFSRFNRFKNAFPGLGIASVAFAGYCAYEYLFIKDEHHHAEGHGEQHH